MKKLNRWLKMEPETVALLLGFGVGLGLAVHEIFLVLPLIVVLMVVSRWTLEKAQTYFSDLYFRPRQPTKIDCPNDFKKRDQSRLTRVVARSVSATVILFSVLFWLLFACAFSRASHVKKEATDARSSHHPVTSGQVYEVLRGPRGRSEIAITFDAGANAECFEDLIAALEKAHVHSTFFITGNWAQRNRECAQAITKHGHEVGNHTWNHVNLTQQPDEIVREEITRAESILTQVSGQDPKPLWRAPYGARDARVLRIANNLGYHSIYWTIDSLDGVEPIKTPDFLINRITSETDDELDGAIILMHVGEPSAASALPAIIGNLQARGFHLVTISKLLELRVTTE